MRGRRRTANCILLSRWVRNGGEEKEEECAQSCHCKGLVQTHCERRSGGAAAWERSYFRTVQKPARRRLAVQGRRGGRCKFQGREREQTQSRGASCTCSPRPCWGTSPSGTQGGKHWQGTDKARESKVLTSVWRSKVRAKLDTAAKRLLGTDLFVRTMEKQNQMRIIWSEMKWKKNMDEEENNEK